MIDLEARKQLAQLLRNLASGRMTDKKFDLSFESLPASGQDFALAEIAMRVVVLKRTTRREVARWILFLQSSQEYEWTMEERDPDPLGVLMSVALAIFMGDILGSVKAGFWASVALSSPFIGYRLWQDYRRQKAGVDAVWPFYRVEDAEIAAMHPKLLSGGR